MRRILRKRLSQGVMVFILAIVVLVAGCGNKNVKEEVTITTPTAVSDTNSVIETSPAGTDDNVTAQTPTTEATITVESPTAEVAPTIEPATIPDAIYEAEDGKMLGGAFTEAKANGYTGDGYVYGLEDEGDGCEITVTVSASGFFDLYFTSAYVGGEKQNDVYVDGVKTGTIKTSSDKFSESVTERVYMDAGSHRISIMKNWGWIYLDNLIVKQSSEMDQSIYDVSAKLVNENADDGAKRLMSYMTDIYGEYFLSGQYSSSMYGDEIKAIWKTTGGKYPAVLGLDLIEASSSRIANGSVSNAAESAIEFHDKGGIITMCWHWNAPEKYLIGTWYRGFYTEETNINLSDIMNGKDTEGYDLLMKDIEIIAGELQKLEDAGVPVLWRPLHEASGGWFWWGASGAGSYKKLWILMYETLTEQYGLNNLIWVWNGQKADWYPGDEYVDIIGEDIYPGERVYTSQASKYMEAVKYTSPSKLVVMSENGCLFDPDQAIRDGAMWGFFATWGGEFVVDTGLVIKLDETYTEETMLLKVYNHEKVITLDELPDLSIYPIKDK